MSRPQPPPTMLHDLRPEARAKADRAYGVDPLASARLDDALRTAMAAVGETKAAAATGVARATLNKIERGEGATTVVPLGRVHRVLERLMADCSAKDRERFRPKAGLMEMVRREGGIRAAARKLGVDASNLRRIICLVSK